MKTVLRAIILVFFLLSSVQADTFYKDVSSPIKGIDPADTMGWGAIGLVVDMFEGLTAYDRDGNVQLAQAESYQADPNGVIHDFKLRPGMVWSDGAPITAHDYVYAARRVAYSSNRERPAYVLAALKNATKVKDGTLPPDALGIEALDDMTVRYTLEAPVSYVEVMALQAAMSPVPRHVVEKYGDDWVKPEHIVVNGAYKLVEITSDGYYVMRKNPLYRDAENVYYDEVRSTYVEDANRIESAVANGEIHAVTKYMAQQTDSWLEEVLGAKFLGGRPTRTAFLIMNPQKVPALANSRVREALSMAILRQEIIDRTLAGHGAPAFAMSPPSAAMNWSGQEPEWAQWSPGKRIAEARRIIEDAGYVGENRITFTLETSKTVNYKKMWGAIVQMWAEIGVNANVVALPSSEIYDKQTKPGPDGSPNFDVIPSGFNLFYDTPVLMYQYLADKMEQSTYQSAASTSELVSMIRNIQSDLAQHTQETFQSIEDRIRKDTYFLPVIHTVVGHVKGPTVDFGVQNFNKLIYARHARPEENVAKF